MSSKINSAIMPGVLLGVGLSVIGIVSALSPALSLLGCCACLLPLGAGLYAVQNYVGKSATPVQIGDGAIMGAVAGAIGGVIYLIVGAPLAYFINAAALEMQMAQMRQAGIDIPLAGFAFVIVGGIVGIIVDAILGLIGGLIGVPLFEKRKGGSAPPPPPPGGFGGPGGGTFGQGA
jgi:hypothetical protein